MRVLSLFDGMSCARIALERAKVKVDKYYVSEIDQWAIKTSSTKYPDTVHLGTVTMLRLYLCTTQRNRDIMYGKPDISKRTKRLIEMCNEILSDGIDLLCGGSPCQGFSFAGKGLNFNDPRSALFFDFVKIYKTLSSKFPELKFLLENVRMKKAHEDVISRIIGIQPIVINSSLLSAQNRERLFWTNIYNGKFGLFSDTICLIPQPKDKGILLRDILQIDVADKYYLSEKALARINRRHVNYLPNIMPDKTGALNTKNNSAQLSIDVGTTLIPVVNSNGELREIDKSTCIDVNYAKGMDNHEQRTMIEVHNLSPRSSESGKGGTGPLSRVDGKTYCVTPDDKNAIEIREVKQISTATESNGNTQPFQQNRVYDVNGLAPALLANMGGERQHLIKEPTSQAERVYEIDGKSVTISASDGGMGSGTGLYVVNSKIRRLTPIEVCRLQTVPDDYFFIDGQQFVSDSQIYKMCGNGWTVDVIVYILSFWDKISLYVQGKENTANAKN